MPAPKPIPCPDCGERMERYRRIDPANSPPGSLVRCSCGLHAYAWDSGELERREPGSKKRHRTAAKRQKMLALLATHPKGLTLEELAGLMHRERAGFDGDMQELHAAGLVHISDWRSNAQSGMGRRAAVWSAGAGKDKAWQPIKQTYRRHSEHMRYGHALANAVRRARQDGASRLIVDGTLIWDRQTKWNPDLRKAA
ncbi:hypothetical protein [Chitinilyticum litopenaei]|uniref:hypothetical protein n=1 Tax=Chitinilyticum litopenaei TaxID=1121276 RepID=UPI0003F96B1E|nr:hypothetical protein [Chitinilyticum litopenaei]